MGRVTPERLRTFVETLLASLGATEETASRTATSLADADLHGQYTHGAYRVELYRRMIADGALDPTATPRVSAETSTTAQIDGQLAFGQVVGRKAVDVLTEKTKQAGVAAVGVRDATHLGRIGEWATRVAEEGLLFAGFVNTQGGAQTVAPAGSADRRLSTNPIAFAVPTGEALAFPLVHDMATSQVSHGKVFVHREEGKPLPDAWTADRDGGSVTDPTAFENGAGALLPLGGRAAGYKGFGLAVVAELFAGTLGDAPVAGSSTADWFSNAAAFIAIDPSVFTSQDAHEDRVRALVEHLRAASATEGVPTGHGATGDETLLPGEPEYRAATRQATEGIELPSGVAATLREVAADLRLTESVPAALADE